MTSCEVLAISEICASVCPLISSYLCLYILPVQLIDQLTKLTECHLVIQQQKQHKSRDQPVKQPMDTFQIDSLAKMVGVFLSSE